MGKSNLASFSNLLLNPNIKGCHAFWLGKYLKKKIPFAVYISLSKSFCLWVITQTHLIFSCLLDSVFNMLWNTLSRFWYFSGNLLLQEESVEDEADVKGSGNIHRIKDHLLFNTLSLLAKIIKECQVIKNPSRQQDMTKIWGKGLTSDNYYKSKI